MNMRNLLLGASLIGALTVAACQAVDRAEAQSELAEKPQFTADGQLILPKGYHEWVYVGSPLTPNALNGGEAPFPEYHNVYIQPSAYKIYKETGTFPEGTIFFKELMLVQRADHPDGSADEVSGRGYFPGSFAGADVAVKDSARFADTGGWGYFNFGHHAPPYAKTAKALPGDACAFCHTANAAKDMVFTQFYPLLQ
ncbi:MAG: cytochrome P460 family protein [Pseudomonadota bacterium]